MNQSIRTNPIDLLREIFGYEGCRQCLKTYGYSIKRKWDLNRKLCLVVGCLILGTSSGFGETLPTYRNAKLSIEERVEDLVSKMTLEEKAAQLRSMWVSKNEIYDNDGNFNEEKAILAIPNGIGQIARPSDTMGLPSWKETPFRNTEDSVAFVNAVQRFLVEKTRLGVPAMFHEELAHGLLAKDSTIFPIPLGLGSTWDPELVERVF